MANGGAKSIGDVRSDIKSICKSVSEGNMKGAGSSPIYRGGSRGGGGGMKKKGGGK